MPSEHDEAVKVYVRLVDGGDMEMRLPAEALQRLERLEAEGYTGKWLIHELLTDDWGPPPVVVTISGTHPDGRWIERKIPYD